MFAFLVASLVLIMIPGPDQALITRNALTGGRVGGLATMAGGALGLSVHATAAALGISALLKASATAFTVLKITGTGYLLWLGLGTLRAARRHTETGEAEEPRARIRVRPIKWLRQGFTSNALNPKIAIFFMTFLPQFMPGHHATLPRAFALSGLFALLYLAWFSGYVLLVEQIGAWLRRPSVQRRIERVTGFLLIGFAVRLAVQQD